MFRTLLAAAAVSLAMPANAQECVPIQVDQAQAEKHGFEIVVTGIGNDGARLVIRANKAGNWVAMVLFHNGMACPAMVGQSLMTRPVGEAM